MLLSIVIPAYNEADNIQSIIKKILSVIKDNAQIKRFQLLIVDDHSSDKTFDIVEQIGDERIVCLRLNRRYGSHTAIRAGLRGATGDAAICLSADGQDDPHCLADMLKKWEGGASIVWALRKNRNSEPWFIQKPAVIFYKILSWINHDNTNTIDLSRADFYLIDRKVIDAINSCPEKNTSLFGLIAWLGFKQEYVVYDRKRRLVGKSKWDFRKRLKLALDWIAAFSGLPLKLISIVGIMITSFGFLGLLVIIFSAIIHRPLEPWVVTVVLVLILNGIQMLMMGILGEYLWRNIEESRNRPLYFIEKQSNLPRNA